MEKSCSFLRNIKLIYQLLKLGGMLSIAHNLEYIFVILKVIFK